MDFVLKSPWVGFGKGKVTDVFLLGAGFSRAVSTRMPTLASLSCETLPKGLQPDLRATLPYLAHNNLELALTYLMTRHPWLTEAQYHRNMGAAYNVLGKVSGSIHAAERAVVEDMQQCPYWLSRLVFWMHDEQAAIITLNYDTLLERAFAEIPIAGNELLGDATCLDQRSLLAFDLRASGAWGPAAPWATAQLLKLHGSLNWYYSGASDFFGETLRLRPAVSWKEVGYHNFDDEVVPFIVPPLGNKAAFFDHAGMRKQWRRAERSIQSADRVFCIGYSLPETDLAIRFLLSRSLSSPVTFFLVDIDRREARVEALRSVLPPSWEIRTDFFGPDWTERLPDYLWGLERQQPGKPSISHEDRIALKLKGRLSPNLHLALGCTPCHFRVLNVTDSRVRVEDTRRKIPLDLTYRCLATVAEHLAKTGAPLRITQKIADDRGPSVERLARPWYTRSCGLAIAAVLTTAGVAAFSPPESLVGLAEEYLALT